MKKFLSIASLFLICACNTVEGAKEGAAADLKPVRATVADYVYPEINHKADMESKPPAPPTYCYKTWDKPVCYMQPQPVIEQDRLVGAPN